MNYRSWVVTNGNIVNVADKADNNDIYTAQSETEGVLYMWDGKEMAVYFHGVLLRMKKKDAKKMISEMQGFMKDVEDLRTMGIRFIGSKRRRHEDAEQRKNHKVSILPE